MITAYTSGEASRTGRQEQQLVHAAIAAIGCAVLLTLLLLILH